jgi:hypothetical protein
MQETLQSELGAFRKPEIRRIAFRDWICALSEPNQLSVVANMPMRSSSRMAGVYQGPAFGPEDDITVLTLGREFVDASANIRLPVLSKNPADEDRNPAPNAASSNTLGCGPNCAIKFGDAHSLSTPVCHFPNPSVLAPSVDC